MFFPPEMTTKFVLLSASPTKSHSCYKIHHVSTHSMLTLGPKSHLLSTHHSPKFIIQISQEWCFHTVSQNKIPSHLWASQLNFPNKLSTSKYNSGAGTGKSILLQKAKIRIKEPLVSKPFDIRGEVFIGSENNSVIHDFVPWTIGTTGLATHSSGLKILALPT